MNYYVASVKDFMSDGNVVPWQKDMLKSMTLAMTTILRRAHGK
jgi:hypothetical protein